jgi:hypothetical protein
MKRIGFLLGLLVVIAWAAPASAGGVLVDCRRGDDLQAAIDAALPGDTLVASGTCVGNFLIDKDLTIRGRATLDGDDSGTVVTVEPDARVVLEELVVTGGAGSGNPAVGGIHNFGDLTLVESSVTGNSAVADGPGFQIATGGIHGGTFGPDDTKLTLIETDVSMNTADATSPQASLAIGAITTAGVLNVREGKIYGNVSNANASGGAFAGAGTTLGEPGSAITLKETKIYANESTGVSSGRTAVIGGLTTNGNAFADNLTVRDNTARAEGAFLVTATGGVAVNNGDLLLERSKIVGNWGETDSPGSLATGGILNGGFGPAVITLVDSKVERNGAAANAGGTATGGMHNTPDGDSVLVDSKVANNTPNQCNFVDPDCF